ncbi:MAG: hypothetical protein R3E12_13165 [Candidatus Eisenbacteria bacterium]
MEVVAGNEGRPMMLRQSAWDSRVHLIALLLVFAGCSSTKDPDNTAGPSGPAVVEIEPTAALQSGTAAYGTEVLAPDIDGFLAAARPVSLPAPGSSLTELFDAEVAGYQLFSTEVSEAALNRRPFRVTADDLRFFALEVTDGEGRAPLAPGTGDAASDRGSVGGAALGNEVGDPDLKAAVKEFLEMVGGTGLDTGQLTNAWDATRFHAASDFPLGLPEGTNDGATFLWNGANVWNAAWHNGGILFWYDGFNHMVLADRHVESLKARNFVGDEFSLQSGAITVLHELGHVIMSRTHCAEDDDEDLMAATLERVMSNRVEMELGRVGQGAPRAGDINAYSDQVAELVRRGGTNCLRDLGWGLPAETLQLTAPATVQTGQTFAADVLIKRLGGDPASNEFVWTWVDTNIEVIRLDGLGLGSRTITAPNEPGQIRIRVKALGKEAETTVTVVGLAAGACCARGECYVAADSVACVEGDGDWQGIGTSCGPTTCPDPTGACCAEDGGCVQVRAADCTGLYLGDETTCDPNPCPQPGACCVGTICALTPESTCDGDFLGEGTSCEPDPCFLPGACCFDAGTCVLEIEPNCDGVFQGEGTSCDPDVCPQPGACCDSEGACLVTLRDQCVDEFLGEGTACDPNPCPQPPEGACCWGEFHERCAVRTQSRCSRELDGTYLGDGTTCFSEPCTDPAAGACCLASGHCEFLRESSCDGTFIGVGVFCSPDPCEAPDDGACCLALGACVIETPSACTQADGQYQGNGTVCVPNPCPQPGGGACCFPGGSCFVQAAADCATNDGQYQGDDTVCEPNPCPEPATGACCLDGNCTVVQSGTCDGAYQGDGSDCSPNPCTENQGACCFPAGDCFVTFESSCADAHGVYQGNDTTCEVDPCSGFGACCVGTSCSLTLPGSCDGEFQGEHTACNPDLTCPMGACCSLDGCTVVVMTACDGTYLGNGTTCSPEPCNGACCLSFGCEIRTLFGCAFDFGDHQGIGTTCEPYPCPIPATVTYLQDGVVHFQGFSTICLKLGVEGPLPTILVTIEIVGPSSSGFEILPVDAEGVVSLDRDIFFYGSYEWTVTEVTSRDADVPVTGDVHGTIVVDEVSRPCSR